MAPMVWTAIACYCRVHCHCQLLSILFVWTKPCIRMGSRLLYHVISILDIASNSHDPKWPMQRISAMVGPLKVEHLEPGPKLGETRMWFLDSVVTTTCLRKDMSSHVIVSYCFLKDNHPENLGDLWWFGGISWSLGQEKACETRSLGFVMSLMHHGSHAQVAATKVSLQRWTAEGPGPQRTPTLRFQNVSSFWRLSVPGVRMRV